MIELDNTKNEKDKLQELVRLAINNKDHELECIIGNNNKFDMNSRIDFVNVVKRLKGKPQFKKTTVTDRLDISIPKDSKYFKTISRVSINGSAINSYCNKENIQVIRNNVTFEKNLAFEKKTLVNKRVFIPNYGIRFTLKNEETIPKDSAIVRDLEREWKTIPKSYRRKKVFTFYHKDGDFKIDLSMVNKIKNSLSVADIIENKLIHLVDKPNNIRESFTEWWNTVKKQPSTMIELQDYNKYYRSIKESRVLESTDYRYELEIEWLGNKTNPEPKFKNISERKQYIDDITEKFLNFTTIIKQAVDESLFIISRDTKLSVLDRFHKLTGTKNKRYFPLPVDLEAKNLAKMSDYSDSNIGNIRMDYLVTEKSDGERNLLYIDNDGKCYLLSRKGALKYSGTVIPTYANSVFDGEFITRDTNGKFMQLLALFDTYVVKGVDITQRSFGLGKDKNGRHIHLHNLVKDFQNGANVMTEDSPYKLNIIAKTYYTGGLSSKKKFDEEAIFTSCHQLLSQINVKYGGLLKEGQLFSYPIDGLIFQPILLGVRQQFVGDEVVSIDGRWNRVFKWKPSDYLTIDFLVKFNKEGGTHRNLVVYHNDNQYQQATLYYKSYHNSGKFAKDESSGQLGLRLINNGEKIESYPENVPFVPIHPYLGTRDINGNIIDKTSQINIPLVNGSPKCVDGSLIENGSTVECKYDFTKPVGFRWIPVKVRHEKAPNNIKTVFSAWSIINKPITTNHITGKELVDTSEIYYKGISNPRMKYMNNFNNFVKREIINRALSNKSRARVLDLACGKLGDILKYAANKVNTLVAIDNSIDSLSNPIDGAAARLMNHRHRGDPDINNLVNRTILLLGDVTKNVVSGDAFPDEYNKFYGDILYGRHHPDGSGKLRKLYNVGSNQFHLVVSNFAIHYMLNSQENFHNFLINVQQNLTDQGYFIGTCQDGKEIMKLLKKGKFEKMDGEHKIISIEPVEEINLMDSPYDQKIVYDYETFHQPSIENLVDIDFVIEEARKFDLKLVDTKLFTEEPDSMFNMFCNEKPDIAEECEKDAHFRDISNFHRWFIFQKVDGFSDTLNSKELDD